MNRHLAVLAISAMLAAAATCEAATDTVKVIKGTPVKGSITRMTSTEVELETQSGLQKIIPVNEIVTIFLDEEPSSMRSVRSNIDDGKYEEALKLLESIESRGVKRAEVQHDVEFYKAFCDAQLALSGDGDLDAAGSGLTEFVNKRNKNYHWLQANQVLGDVLVASGKAQAAAACYEKVAQAPWPDYKMRAGVALGRALLSQGKPAEAAKKFDDVLAVVDDSELAQTQRLLATTGKIRCQAADKSKTEETVKAVDAILAKADPDQADVMAQAYLALGTAYRAAGRDKEAIVAFLHIDLLYANQSDAHAEALGNLVALWKADKRPDREQNARQTLERRYPNSPWLKK